MTEWTTTPPTVTGHYWLRNYRFADDEPEKPTRGVLPIIIHFHLVGNDPSLPCITFTGNDGW